MAPRRGPQCKGCLHGKRPQLDHFLATGGAIRDAASKFGLTKSCIDRHRSHILAVPAATTAIVAAGAAYEVDVQSKTARAILTKIQAADRLLAGAEEDRDWGAAVRAIAEFRTIWMDVAKLTGELKDTGLTLQVFLGSSDWQNTQAILVEAVREHPEVAEKVAAALEAVGRSR